DGMAMAYRAGAVLEDMEFVQFHPTALALEGAPPFLITEALRGEGAILRNVQGERFMPSQRPVAELAPRDILSRAILKEMEKTGAPHVLLDATHLPSGTIRKQFPTVYEACLKYGIDITREPVPVNPSAHFFIGGVKTDLRGRTTLPGLFAAGEVACTGVHGANRLASNSLLEGLVFGALAGEAAAEYGESVPRPEALPTPPPISEEPVSAIPEVDRHRKILQDILWEKAGILRSRTTLEEAASAMAPWTPMESARLSTRGELEFRNMLTVAGRVVEGAMMREESVGTHYREDYPERTGKVVHYALKRKGS
ncbi:MAG: FAD-binding protein, partial [Nitrospirae bacterium]|nr:FAD-binding protein [Nitrospirota bacterium]